MKFTGERVVPFGMRERPDLLRDHLMRYCWALEFVGGLRVVDLGCGTGYGSFVLSWLADDVIGLDNSVEAISFALWHFSGVRYWVGDVERDLVPFADCYVAFEVLEHLYDPLALVVRLRGLLLWSAPVESVSKFHRQVWSLQEIEDWAPLGTEFWYQSSGGSIVPRCQCEFSPKYVLGRSLLS